VQNTAVLVAQMRVDAGCDKIVPEFLPKDSENWRKCHGYKHFVQPLKSRMKFYDDALKMAMKQGAKQIIELGSGLSTRVIRLGLKDVPYFEVDMGTFFSKKAEAFKEKYELKNYKFANINYIETDPIKELKIPTDVPTLVIWEGNAMYIPTEVAKPALEKILGSFPKVWLTLDFFRKAHLDMMIGWSDGMVPSKPEEYVEYGLMRRWFKLFNAHYTTEEIYNLAGKDKPMRLVKDQPLWSTDEDDKVRTDVWLNYGTGLLTTEKEYWAPESEDDQKDDKA